VRLSPPLRSLRAIAFMFVGAISGATVLTGLAVYLALIGAIDRQVDRRLVGEADELLAGAPSDAALVTRIAEERQRRDSGDIGFLLIDARGRQLAGNIGLAEPLVPGFATIDHAAGIPGLSRGRALVLRLPSGARLALVAESEPIDNHDSQRVRILLLGFGGILVLVIAGTLVLSLVIRRNIEAVRRAAEAIVEGDMRARVPIAGSGTAFGQQAQAFNRMLDRIEGLMASLSQVSNDIAHDLRTPLARLHGQLASLAAEPAAEPLQARIEEAVAQSDEMLAMFAAILRIAEVEGGDRRAMFAPLDLAELAADTAGALEGMAEETGHILRLGPWQRTPIEGDQRLLTQLVVNLVENAVSHTPAGTAITVSAARQGGAAVLTVADTGPGIPAGQQALAMRRFGRLERSRGTPGHGLGLPLAHAIAVLHRGEVTLADGAPGLVVRVTLPIAE
jgi:signal transduction histidine kinase